MRMPAILAAFAASVAALTPLHAAAQDDERTAEERAQDEARQIIVEGERQTNRTARDMARELTPRAYSATEPLPRFQARICPGVWGLSPEFAQPVIDRIYDNAERAGIPINEVENCAANVWVIVVEDPQATYQQLREERSFLVRGLHPRVRREIADQIGPVVAWHRTSTRTLEGVVVQTGFEAVTAQMEARLTGGGLVGIPTDRMSRTATAIRQDIDYAILLVQRSALADRDLLAVADFATMRLLGRARQPEGDTPFSTVLSFVNEDWTADRMTEFDWAYLDSLYGGRPNMPSRMALRNLGTRMINASDERDEREGVTPSGS